LEEDRKLKRKQDEVFKEGLKEDRFKKVRIFLLVSHEIV